MTGALAGLGFGALAGLGVLSGAIPVIGPAIAGGTLGIILTNAAAGAGIGGLVGALAGAGIPEDEAATIRANSKRAGDRHRRGHDRADEARAILRRYDAYDMSSRPDVAGYAMPYDQDLDVPVRSEDVMDVPQDEGIDVAPARPGRKAF